MSDGASVQILTDPVQQTTCSKCRCTMETAGLPVFSQIVCPQCGNEMQVPARLGHFLLMHLIGTGGMGGVYWAHDQVLNRDVAIKVMLKSLGDDRKFVETFLREAQAAARINHPHIAQIYSFGQEKGQPYIVMELVPGGGLDKLMAVTPQLDQALVMRVGAEVADGLKRASEEGLIHGDIKPENILISDTGESKLVDFGIASMSGGKSNEIWGTPYYIAPEKVRRQKADHRADIYSLGGTLYHALTGVPPFDGPDAVAVVKARFAGPPKPLAELRRDISPEVTAIIDRMLYLEPARRYPTYDSLLSDMRQFVKRAGPGQIAVSKKVLLKRKGGAGVTTGHVTGNVTGSVTGSVTGAVATGNVGSVTAGVPIGKVAVPPGKAPSAPAPSGRPKGIVLQKGAMAEAVRNGPTPATNGDAESAEEERGHNWTLILLVTIGLLVLAAVGTVVGLIMAKAARERQVQAVASQTEGTRNDAMKAIRGVVDKVETLSVAMTDRVAKGTVIVDEAAKLVADALGEDVRASLTAGDAGAAQDQPPVVTSARAMYAELSVLQAAASGISTQVAAVVEAARAADVGTNSVAALQAALADLQRRTLEIEAAPGLTQADRSLEKLTASRDVVRRQAASAQADQQQREKERKRIEDERLAKEEAERKEAERKAAVEADVAKVRDCEGENVALLHKFEFKEARRALGRLVDELKSEEGRKALEVAQERVERLAELHVFLVGRVVGYRHPTEGWTVQAADARSLTVGGKDVDWAEVGDVRMVLFINTFLGDERQARELRLRERVRQSINGALYCATFVKASVPVQELAGKLVAKAIELYPDAQADARRIVPELIKE
jgi:hypothetical protein